MLLLGSTVPWNSRWKWSYWSLSFVVRSFRILLEAFSSVVEQDPTLFVEVLLPPSRQTHSGSWHSATRLRVCVANCTFVALILPPLQAFTMFPVTVRIETITSPITSGFSYTSFLRVTPFFSGYKHIMNIYIAYFHPYPAKSSSLCRHLQ